MANPKAMNDYEEDRGMDLFALIPIMLSVTIAAAFAIFIVWPLANDVADKFMPNGETANVTVLTVYTAHNALWDTRICIYEIENERNEMPDCLYNEGDAVTVYQVNAGYWYPER